MPVIWTGPGDSYAYAALAVPCSTCGAYIGKPCTAHYSAGAALDKPHRPRAEMADAFGFRTSKLAPELAVPVQPKSVKLEVQDLFEGL
jgi:hypothetical protein